MLEGTAAKTRDGSTRGTPTVAQQHTPLPRSKDAHETGVTQVMEASQLEAHNTSRESITPLPDPRLGRTRAAAMFSYLT